MRSKKGCCIFRCSTPLRFINALLVVVKKLSHPWRPPIGSLPLTVSRFHSRRQSGTGAILAVLTIGSGIVKLYGQIRLVMTMFVECANIRPQIGKAITRKETSKKLTASRAGYVGSGIIFFAVDLRLLNKAHLHLVLFPVILQKN